MQFIDFIQTYWKVIAVVVVVLLQFIAIFIKGKKVYFDLISDLVMYIKEAENLYNDGSTKMAYVIKCYFEDHPDSDIPTWYLKNVVEHILSCPTKKGGLGREEDER